MSLNFKQWFESDQPIFGLADTLTKIRDTAIDVIAAFAEAYDLKTPIELYRFIWTCSFNPGHRSPIGLLPDLQLMLQKTKANAGNIDQHMKDFFQNFMLYLNPYDYENFRLTYGNFMAEIAKAKEKANKEK